MSLRNEVSARVLDGDDTVGMMGGAEDFQRVPGFVVSRDFNAPRELVWRMWTVAENVKRWWGPKGFLVTKCRIDFHIGGKFLMGERTPSGTETWTTGTYKEIVPMLRIVCTASFADENGNVVPASYYGMSEDFPLEMLWTITFEDLLSKTRLTVYHEGVTPGVSAEDIRQGWEQSFDKLAEALRK